MAASWEHLSRKEPVAVLLTRRLATVMRDISK
jgi:hypothetical protein